MLYKKKIYHIFVHDGFLLINPENLKKIEIVIYIIIFLTPIISFIYFVLYFSIVFYYTLYKTNVEKNDGRYEIYEVEIKKNYTLLSYIIGFNVAFALVLAIPFIILDTYFKIFILVISFPFKMYPIKYYFGIMYEGLKRNI